MSRVRFIATLSVAIILGAIGYIVGGIFPLPPPFTLLQSRLFFTLVGILIGLSFYARFATFLVQTSATLVSILARRVAQEIAFQFQRRRFAQNHSRLKKWQEDLKNCLIVDTSAIIDGRILEVAKTNFLVGKIVVPNFVLQELQQVADSADSIKRNRGRYGLDLVAQLKKIKDLELVIWDKNLGNNEVKVDDKLVTLAKALSGRLLTCDYNLARVATISGISVLNLNELGNALKSLPLPGEKLTVRIISLGKEKDQGVGYLTDGTMVVIKNGAAFLGQEIETEVSKILQSGTGRIVFGKLSTFR